MRLVLAVDCMHGTFCFIWIYYLLFCFWFTEAWWVGRHYVASSWYSPINVSDMWIQPFVTRYIVKWRVTWRWGSKFLIYIYRKNEAWLEERRNFSFILKNLCFSYFYLFCSALHYASENVDNICLFMELFCDGFLTRRWITFLVIL